MGATEYWWSQKRNTRRRTYLFDVNITCISRHYECKKKANYFSNCFESQEHISETVKYVCYYVKELSVKQWLCINSVSRISQIQNKSSDINRLKIRPRSYLYVSRYMIFGVFKDIFKNKTSLTFTGRSVFYKMYNHLKAWNFRRLLRERPVWLYFQRII